MQTAQQQQTNSASQKRNEMSRLAGEAQQPPAAATTGGSGVNSVSSVEYGAAGAINTVKALTARLLIRRKKSCNRSVLKDAQVVI